MNKSLYTEAIEAAEQIKLSTEEKVKQQIIESISPQVRRMVEKKLFEDTSSCDNESTQESVDVDNEETSSKDKDQSIKLNSESRRILNKLINNNSKKEYAFNKIASLRESLRSLQKAIILAENSKDADISKPRIVLLYKNLVNEISNLKTNSIIKSNNEVLNEFYKLSKELDNMSKRQSNNRFLNESLESLLEMDLFEAEESDESTEEISFLDDEENMEDAEETEDADAEDDATSFALSNSSSSTSVKPKSKLAIFYSVNNCLIPRCQFSAASSTYLKDLYLKSSFVIRKPAASLYVIEKNECSPSIPFIT